MPQVCAPSDSYIGRDLTPQGDTRSTIASLILSCKLSPGNGSDSLRVEPDRAGDLQQ
jgi:hypothetical protein